MDNNQSDTLTLGDFMAESAAPEQKTDVTLDEFMGTPETVQPPPPIAPVEETHKDGFVQGLGKVLYAGMLNGSADFNELIGYVGQLTPAAPAVKAIPGAEATLKKTFVDDPREQAAVLKKEAKTGNIMVDSLLDFVSSVGNLGVTLPLDLALGGATKTALTGKILPEVASILGRIPDFAIGSGIREFVKGVETKGTVAERTMRGVTSGAEAVAINTLFAKAGGVEAEALVGKTTEEISKIVAKATARGFLYLPAIGAANAYYSAAKEGRIASKEEVISGTVDALAYQTMFTMIPVLRKATKNVEEKIALGSHEKEMQKHLDRGSIEGIIETFKTMIDDPRIRPEVKESLIKPLDLSQESIKQPETGTKQPPVDVSRSSTPERAVPQELAVKLTKEAISARLAEKGLTLKTEADFITEGQSGRADKIKANPKLIDFWNFLRAETGVDDFLNSGVRSPEHNAFIKGEEGSLHTKGQAIDIAWKKTGMTQAELAELGHAAGFDVESLPRTPAHVHLEIPTEGSPTPAFQSFDANGKVKANVAENIRGVVVRGINKIGRTVPTNVWESAYQKVVNRFQSIETASEKAKLLGMTLQPGEDPAISAERYLSISGQVRNVLDHGTFKITPEGKVVVTGEGLKPILDSFEAGCKEKNQEIRENELKEYLIARRTVEDLQRPKNEISQENIVSPEQVAESKAKLAEIKKKYGADISVFEKTAERLYAFQTRILELLVDSGNLSQEQFAGIVEKNPHYIPFDRMLPEEAPAGGTPTNKNRFSGAKSPVKRIKGSKLEIYDPIESVIKNTYKIMDIAARNKVFKDFYPLSELPELGINKVAPEMQVIKVGEGEIGPEAGTIFRPSAFKPKGNVIEGYIDGKRKYLEVSENLREAMTGLSEQASSLLVKILAKPAQWLRTGATTTPEFILRNPIRDQWTALIQTHLGWKPFIDSGSAIADILGKNEVYNDWIRSGGSYSGFVELSRPNLEKMVLELQGKKDILKELNIITKLSDLSQIMEQGTRLGVYKAGLRAGLSPVEAARASRESSVDFARRGSATRDLNATIAFLNAGIQGVDKSLRTIRKDPIGMTVKSLASITVPSVMLYLKNRMDEDYKELPRWQKDLFWMTKINGTWVRIPKPFLYGQVFGSLPERFLEYLDTKDPASFNGILASIYGGLSPVAGDPMSGMIPTALKPIFENMTNYSFFKDRPIVPESKEGLIPSEQSGRNDTETAKMIGEILNYPPAKIENLVRGWSGGMGRYALEAGDLLMRVMAEIQGKETKEKRPIELSDIPGVKGFVSKDITSGQSESVNTFYENRDKVSRQYKTYRKYLRDGEKEKALSLRDEHPEIRFHPKFTAYSRKFTEIGEKVDSIIESKDIPEDEKRATIKTLELEKIELAKKANKLLK